MSEPEPNPVTARMADHRSIRDYQPEPVPGSRIAAAVQAAQMAATSSHVQAYCVIRVTGEAARQRLVELTGGQQMVGQAGAFLIVCADVRRHQLLSRRADRPHEQNLETFLVAVVDASLFAQNLALAFESEGLGICYIGGLRNQLHDVDALLDVPDGVLPLYGLCVGEPRSIPDRKPRLPLEAMLFEDAYPSDDDMLALIDAYDEEMATYYTQRGAAGRDWSGGVVRKHEAARRTYLAGYYTGKGAVLT